jgi:hypothetical protein
LGRSVMMVGRRMAPPLVAFMLLLSAASLARAVRRDGE